MSEVPWPQDRVIHKYPLAVSSYQTEPVSGLSYLPMDLPAGWKPVLLELQNGEPTLWAEVPYLRTKAVATLPEKLYIIGTGVPFASKAVAFAPPMVHIGSVQVRGFVWHFYRVGHQLDIK